MSDTVVTHTKKNRISNNNKIYNRVTAIHSFSLNQQFKTFKIFNKYNNESALRL